MPQLTTTSTKKSSSKSRARLSDGCEVLIAIDKPKFIDKRISIKNTTVTSSLSSESSTTIKVKLLLSLSGLFMAFLLSLLRLGSLNGLLDISSQTVPMAINSRQKFTIRNLLVRTTTNFRGRGFANLKLLNPQTAAESSFLNLEDVTGEQGGSKKKEKKAGKKVLEEDGERGDEEAQEAQDSGSEILESDDGAAKSGKEEEDLKDSEGGSAGGREEQKSRAVPEAGTLALPGTEQGSSASRRDAKDTTTTRTPSRLAVLGNCLACSAKNLIGPGAGESYKDYKPVCKLNPDHNSEAPLTSKNAPFKGNWSFLSFWAVMILLALTLIALAGYCTATTAYEVDDPTVAQQFLETNVDSLCEELDPGETDLLGIGESLKANPTSRLTGQALSPYPTSLAIAHLPQGDDASWSIETEGGYGRSYLTDRERMDIDEIKVNKEDNTITLKYDWKSEDVVLTFQDAESLGETLRYGGFTRVRRDVQLEFHIRDDENLSGFTLKREIVQNLPQDIALVWGNCFGRAAILEEEYPGMGAVYEEAHGRGVDTGVVATGEDSVQYLPGLATADANLSAEEGAANHYKSLGLVLRYVMYAIVFCGVSAGLCGFCNNVACKGENSSDKKCVELCSTFTTHSVLFFASSLVALLLAYCCSTVLLKMAMNSDPVGEDAIKDETSYGMIAPCMMLICGCFLCIWAGVLSARYCSEDGLDCCLDCSYVSWYMPGDCSCCAQGCDCCKGCNCEGCNCDGTNC